MPTKPVVIRRVQGLLKAQAIQAHLRSAGIPATLGYESAGPAIGITMDGLGEVRVFVPARLARRARRLLLIEGHFPMRRLRRRLVKARKSSLGRSRATRPRAIADRRR